MTRSFPLMVRDQSGSSAAEFALVLPLLILFLFGIIDVGRYMWTLNRAEKAVQMGVRYAVVSDPVADALAVEYVAHYSIPGGDPVPASVFTSAVCTDTDPCTVTGTASGEDGRNATAFTNIVSWMRKFYPMIQESDVTVRYDNVGLGYSGDPTGPDVSPLTTVIVSGMSFDSLLMFGGSITLPDIKASLTMEDGECSVTSATECNGSN